MDEDAASRRGRARASMVGAAALLVLSFGPSALALSPSASSAPSAAPVRAALTATASTTASAAVSTERLDQRGRSPHRTTDEDGSAAG